MAGDNINIKDWRDYDEILEALTNGEVLIRDLSDNKIKRMQASLLSGGVDTVDQWLSTTTYSDGQIISYNSLLWESLQDNNLNNPPVEGSYWTQVNKSTANGFGRYAIGVYTVDPTVVINGDSLYILSENVTLPYNSTDFYAELTAGDWVGVEGDTFSIANRNDRKLSRAFANGFFHEFGFNAYEDSGALYIEVFNPLQEWNIATGYVKYNSIFYNGYKYTAYKNSTGVKPDTDFTDDPMNPNNNSWFIDEPWDGKLRGNLDGTVRNFELDVDGTGPNGGIFQALIPGTETTPTVNYVYGLPVGDSDILQLTVSTSLPVGGAIFAGYVGCFDVVSHQSGTPYLPMQRFTNAFYKDSIEKSLIGAMREKLRYMGITYEGGVDSELEITTNPSAKDSLNVNNTAGLVAQLWPQSIGENLNINGYVILNDYNSLNPDQPKITFINDLNEITTDALGNSLLGNGTRFGLEIVGICASGDNTVDMLGVLLPNGEYGNDSDAIGDVNNYTVTTVPNDFYVTSFRMCRIVVRYSTGSSGTYTNLLGTNLVQDRRRWPVGSFGGGSGSSGGGGATVLTDLLDVLYATYSGSKGYSLVVADAENGVVLEPKGRIYNASRTFFHELISTATANFAATFQKRSGIVAYLDDITGGGGGLTIPTQTPVSIADAATTNIPLDNTQLNYSFADGNTTWAITVNGGSDTEVKKAVRILDNSANNSAVIITLSNANMTIKEDDGNNLELAANSVYELEVKGRSTTVCLLSIIPDKA